MDVSALLVSAAILGGVGTTFAALIALAHRRLWVWEDPRIDEISGMLPGTNCGACGEAGCRAFAEALVGGDIEPAGCTVMGEDERSDVAGYLGVDVGEASKRVARLLCAGGCDVAPRQAEYSGLKTCSAANAVAGGGKACAWGCLGLADCEVVCDVDAIFMNEVDLPVVIPERCTACGDCVEACPKDLFALMPESQHLIVQCKNLLEGGQWSTIPRMTWLVRRRSRVAPPGPSCGSRALNSLSAASCLREQCNEDPKEGNAGAQAEVSGRSHVDGWE
jgi:Na+-translocating ferredoxin:NAD+ oxidoreductase RNF subunit RnfB